MQVPPPPFTHAKVTDLARIVNLPIVPELSEGEVEAISKMFFRSSAFAAGGRFFQKQAEGIAAFLEHGSYLAPVPVGGGKTGLAYVTAKLAYRAGHRVILLVVPSNLVPQMKKKSLPWWRQRIQMDVPFHFLHGMNKRARARAAKVKTPGCYIAPFSMLSSEDGHEILSELNPTLVIFDEVHFLARFSAARSRRFRTYMREHEPTVCAMSGTLSNRSIKDWAHISDWTLGSRSPVPQEFDSIETWDNIVKSYSNQAIHQEVEVDPSPLYPLVNWANSHFPGVALPESREGVQRAFRLRMKTAPGVIVSETYEYGAPIYFANLEVEKPSEKLDDLAKQVDEQWVAPTGDEISHGMHKWRWLYELSSGFYHDLRWPKIDNAEVLERSQIAWEVEQIYNKQLREFFAGRHRPGLDTPKLVGQSFYQHGNEFVKKPELYDAWLCWKAILDDGEIVERESVPVWVDDYKVRGVAQWVAQLKAESKNKPYGGLVWAYHKTVLSRISAHLRELGHDVLTAYAGDTFNNALTDENNARKIVVASIAAHGTGKELQYMSNVLTVEWPRSASKVEQMIGRAHRPGQEVDDFVHHSMHKTESDWLNLAASLVDAVYQRRVMGVAQKVLDGDWLFEPKIYPPEYLTARGLRSRSLDEAEMRALKEKFQEIKE